MRNKLLALVMVGAAFLAAPLTGSPQNNGVIVAVVLEPPRTDIPDCTLVEKLDTRLALRGGYAVITPGRDSVATPLPGTPFDFRQMLTWGEENGCHYIIYLRIDGRRIAVRKQTSVPLILSRYVVEGCLEGTFSLIDVRRAKLVNTWDIGTKVSGPRQWQVADDYPDDPDLHIPAPQKVIFLQKLDEKAVTTIFETVSSHLRAK